MKDALGDVQSVLVLGATSEIGQAIVRRLVARRARQVVLAARKPSACEPFAAELRGAGAHVTMLTFDAARTDGHHDVVEAAAEACGGDLDVVLVAFGLLGDQADFEDHPSHAVQAATVNYTGAVSAGLEAARRLREQGHGVLVILSSVAGVRVRKANFVYGSTKAGIDGFALGLGDALHGSGASVLVVRPGFVRTKMTEGLPEAPFATTPDAVADAVVRGIAKGSGVVWVPGILRFVFAGLRLLPRPLWRRMPG